MKKTISADYGPLQRKRREQLRDRHDLVLLRVHAHLPQRGVRPVDPHFTVVIGDEIPPTWWQGVAWTRHTLDGAYVGGAAPYGVKWALDKLDQTNTAIGGAWWNQTGANATFDEVRIWKGALTHADIEANAATSCDTVLKSFRETAKFRFLQNGQRWGARPLADGLYLDRHGLTLIVR